MFLSFLPTVPLLINFAVTFTKKKKILIGIGNKSYMNNKIKKKERNFVGQRHGSSGRGPA
jgi:hypothetical protein